MMKMETNDVVLIEKSLKRFNSHVQPISTISFLHKIHSNALSVNNVVLYGNKKLWSKTF